MTGRYVGLMVMMLERTIGGTSNSFPCRGRLKSTVFIIVDSAMAGNIETWQLYASEGKGCKG